MEAAMPAGMPKDAEVLRKYSTWFLIYGVVLIALGVFSIVAPGIATLATTLMVGWLLIIGGGVGLFMAFSAGVAAPGFWWHLLTSVLYLLAGLAILFQPISGVLTLTIVLAAYLLAGGATRILLAFGYKPDLPGAWGWVLFSGMVDIVLALIIIAGLPGTAIWVLGLMVGINLLMMGVSIVMLSLGCKRLMAQAPA
jgi:uncharacterized membrane protein HdeD (DUF308 family)